MARQMVTPEHVVAMSVSHMCDRRSHQRVLRACGIHATAGIQNLPGCSHFNESRSACSVCLAVVAKCIETGVAACHQQVFNF